MVAAVTMVICHRIVAVWMPVTTMPVLVRYTSMSVSIGHLVMAMVSYHASMPVPVSHFVRWTVRHTVDWSIGESVRQPVRQAVGSALVGRIS